MVDIEFIRDSKNNCIGAVVSGHTERKNKNEDDALCAAISILFINTINSLEKIVNAKLEYKINNDGFLKFKIISKYNYKIKIIMDSLILGIKSIYNKKYMKICFL